MPQEFYYTILNTDAGWVGIVGSAKGLLRTTLPRHSPQEARQELGDSLTHAKGSPQVFDDLSQRLSAYFSGQKVNFPDKLNLSGATAFQRRVWEATRHIPYGEKRSYRRIAEQIGQSQAARAVGQALGKNPLPILVPCHRVLTHNGKLGGFTGGAGMKLYLLRLEASTDGK